MSQQRKHQILATRTVVSDKGPGPSALQKRFSTKTESSEASKAFIKGEMVQDTGILRERVRVAPSWQFELLLWDISFHFSLANHYNLPGSQSIFGISQDPSTCAHGSLSQDGPFQRGVLLEHPLTLLPLWPARSLFCACVIGEVS